MRDHSIAGLGLSLSPRKEGFFATPSCCTVPSGRKEKKSEIFNYSIEMCKKLWNPEPWKLRNQAVNKKNPNSISLPKLLILSFLMSPLWSKIRYFLFFFLPIQTIPKGGRESSKVCTHWHFTVKLHTQNMHEKRHLEVILTKHWNPFLKEPKKTFSGTLLLDKTQFLWHQHEEMQTLSKQPKPQSIVGLARPNPLWSHGLKKSLFTPKHFLIYST